MNACRGSRECALCSQQVLQWKRKEDGKKVMVGSKNIRLVSLLGEDDFRGTEGDNN